MAMAMPTITHHPANVTAPEGATATFSVTAGVLPGGLTYQWQNRPPGSPNFVDIAGATATTFTTPAFTAADNNTAWRVRVTNAADTADSHEAVVTVTPAATTTTTVNGPPRATNVGWPPGHGHIVTHVAPPQSFMTTRGEKNLLIAVIVLLVFLAALLTWVLTSHFGTPTQSAPTASAPVSALFVPCVKACEDAAIKAGIDATAAKAACATTCGVAPVPPAPAPAAPPPPAPVPVASAAQDYDACVQSLEHDGVQRHDAEHFCLP